MHLCKYNWSIQVVQCVCQSEERVFVRCMCSRDGISDMTQNVAVSRALPCSSDGLVMWFGRGGT
jgi:hypothetical protein